MDGAVTENAAQHRFELLIDGSDGDIAAAYYRLEDGVVVLTHTEVPFEYSGQGIGSRLARGVFDLLRAQVDRLVEQGFARPAVRDAIVWTTSIDAAFDALESPQARGAPTAAEVLETEP